MVLSSYTDKRRAGKWTSESPCLLGSSFWPAKMRSWSARARPVRDARACRTTSTLRCERDSEGVSELGEREEVSE